MAKYRDIPICFMNIGIYVISLIFMLGYQTICNLCYSHYDMNGAPMCLSECRLCLVVCDLEGSNWHALSFMLICRYVHMVDQFRPSLETKWSPIKLNFKFNYPNYKHIDGSDKMLITFYEHWS